MHPVIFIMYFCTHAYSHVLCVISQVMAPVSKALDVLQSDKMAYLGVLVPTINILVEKLQSLKQENLQYCGPLVNAIISGVNRRFSYLSGKKYLMATASHPMFRMSYIPNEQKDDIILRLKQELSAAHSPHVEETIVSRKPENESDEITDYFSRNQENVLDELNIYLQSTANTPDSAFQHLSKMKRVFIKCNTGVPASAACERLFSVGKDIFLPKRNRLSDSHFEKLLLCRINRSGTSASV